MGLLNMEFILQSKLCDVSGKFSCLWKLVERILIAIRAIIDFFQSTAMQCVAAVFKLSSSL